jgi:hypothetical protein
MDDETKNAEAAGSECDAVTNRRCWLLLCAYVVVGAVLGMAFCTAIALQFTPLSSLPDSRFEIPGLGGPPGALIGAVIFLFTRKS